MVENNYDTIIWVRFDKYITTCDCDIYCVLTYLPPSRSQFYKYCNVDLFYVLESKICDYSNHGKVMAIGDFISRTRNGIDFISGDKLPVTVRN